MSESVLPMFSSRSFIVSGLTVRSFIHFEFIFVYGVRKCSSFILLQVVDQFSTTATKRVKYAGVYLPKETKDLYIENYMSFPLPLGLPCVSWASQECCFFYLRSSLWSSDLPLFYFCGLFPFLSFSHCQSGPFPPILTT